MLVKQYSLELSAPLLDNKRLDSSELVTWDSPWLLTSKRTDMPLRDTMYSKVHVTLPAKMDSLLLIPSRRLSTIATL